MEPADMTRTMLEQVRLALIEREVEHRFEGPTVSMHYGSADVEVEVLDAPPVPMVTVRATVLFEVQADDNEDELLVLRALNERNMRLRFGKFYLHSEEARVLVEYEMLGSHMQPEELLHALSVVATLADDHDDLLMEQIGRGRRASDVSGRSEAVRPF